MLCADHRRPLRGCHTHGWPKSSAVNIPPEITILEDRFKNGGDLGFQHRGFIGVWNGPLDHDLIEATVRRLYDAYRKEIEQVDPDATIKRINVVLNRPGVNGETLLHAMTDADEEIESWPPATLEIKLSE